MKKWFGIALVGLTGLASADYLKLWEPKMNSQLQGASTGAKSGGYWFTYGGVTGKVDPLKELPLKNNIATNDALKVTASGTWDYGAAGFDFFDSGSSSTLPIDKAPYAWGNTYTGMCFVFSNVSAADMIKVVAKQTDTKDDGKDPASAFVPAGSTQQKFFVSLTNGFTAVSGGPTYGLAKITGLELAFSKIGTFTLTEVGLTTGTDCSEAGQSSLITIPSSTSEMSSSGSSVKIWEASNSNQIVNPAATSSASSGYWYTLAKSGPTIAPTSGANLISSVTANAAMVAKVVWQYTTDAAVAALGFDFFNNGSATTKKAMDLSAYAGTCVVYSATNDRVNLVLKQNGVADDGSDYAVTLGAGNGKVFIPWTSFAQPVGATTTYSQDLTEINAMQFAFKGSASIAISEMWLGDGCPATVTKAPDAASIKITAASSSSAKPSSSSAKPSSSSTKPSSSSAASAVLGATSSHDFGISAVSGGKVQFFAQGSREVSLDVYSMQGTLVTNLYHGKASGNMTASWNQNAVQQGVYMLRLTSGSEVRVLRTTVSR